MKLTYNTCPCDRCVCIPVCRHKNWTNLIYQCPLIFNYIKSHTSHDGVFYYRLVIEEILKPTEWKLDEKGYDTYVFKKMSL